LLYCFATDTTSFKFLRNTLQEILPDLFLDQLAA